MSRRRHVPKLQGEVAETLFTLKAVSHGLVVSNTFGDSAKYDLIVDHRGRLSRVQVKSVSTLWRTKRYRIKVASGGDHVRHPYSGRQVDFIAIYVFPCKAWYIIPVSQTCRQKFLYVWPHKHVPKSRFNRFREAWGLLIRKDGQRRQTGRLRD